MQWLSHCCSVLLCLVSALERSMRACLKTQQRRIYATPHRDGPLTRLLASQLGHQIAGQDGPIFCPALAGLVQASLLRPSQCNESQYTQR